MNSQFRLKNHLLLVALAAAYPAVGFAASAARIEFVSGNVVAVTPAGIQRALNRGAELEAGEAIRTGDNARAQLRFSDGAMMSLQPQTEFRIDEYKYSGKVDGEERGFFSLIKGGLRTITGLVGKGNRDNYRVTTSVATIGIRGTEYSTTYSGGTDGVLNLSTGEGAVQVCNSGGCVTISSGESAVVTGVTPPTKTLVPPKAATTPTNAEPAKAEFSSAETTSESGRPLIFGPDLTSGTGYAYTGVYYDTSGSYTNTISADSASATFGSGSKLLNISDGNNTLAAGTVISAFSLDGVIGWGLWSSGSFDGGYGSPVALKDVHYVVGKPTSASELQNLTGMTGTYQLVGYTTPTSSAGYTGSNVTGSLTADFAGPSTTIDANVGFTMNGQNVTASVTGMSMSGSTFNGGSGSTNLSSGSVTMQGLFAGTNASHAGLTYLIDGSTAGLGDISGAQVYKQTGLSATGSPL